MVNGDGTLVASTVPAGTSLTVSRVSQGVYQVNIAGLGNACPVPTANAFAQTFMFLNGGSCGGGRVINTLIQTGDGQDHPFALLSVGSGPAPAAAANAKNNMTALPKR